MLPVILQSFLAYSVIEYCTVMGLIDNGIRIFLYNPEMSQDFKLRLMALEVCIIGLFGLSLLVFLHHLPVVSCLMIWSCVSSTKDLWQVLLRRYWNDFLEFEHFKPRQLFVPPAAPPAQVPHLDKDKVLRNGGVDDNRIPQPVAQTHAQMHAAAQMAQNHLQAQYNRQLNQPRPAPSPPRFTQTWATSLQSAMSTLRKVRKRPPGLVNNSQSSLCSVNVVLHCLAGTPMLADSLSRDKPRLKPSQNIQEFMTELCDVLGVLQQCEQSLVSTEALMQYASSLGPPQPQNDCVEWLMWLLEVIHSSFRNPDPSEVEPGLQRYKLLRAVPLAQPLLMLYEPSQLPAALARMKAECLDKIELASALQSTTYTEPIQRLSEVEWLNHKLSNHSVMDDMFTGQVVESQHCKVCHHLSVSVQPFKVLPLPIVSSTQLPNQCVSVQDCLAKFSQVERLYGSNGLNCRYCNLRKPTQTYSVDQQVKPQVFKRTVLDSGVGGDSPLYTRPHLPDLSAEFLSPIRLFPDDRMDNSAFHDVLHAKASTPMYDGQQRQVWTSGLTPSPIYPHPRATSSPLQPNPHLTDGERQALISQLPDFLIIQLMRLTFKNGRMVKVNTPVSVPLSDLDCSHIVSERLLGGDHKSSNNGCYKYCLYAMVVHLGENSVSGGHYVAYTQTDAGTWYCCDDDKVATVNMNYEAQTRQVKENVYLLCYRKVKLI